MALVDRIAVAPPGPLHGMPCSLGALETQLATQPDESAALCRMLYDLGWNATQVWDALRAEGYDVGRQSINRHRGRKCRCYR
jgi:hypothetical protein